MAEKNGTVYLVLANREVKEWREDFHGAKCIGRISANKNIRN